MIHEPHVPRSKLSDVILGGQDGLVNILGLSLGLVAASSSIHIVVAGGLAATFAESISMGAVAYTSKMTERDHYTSEYAREVREIKEVPNQETQEVKDIYAAKGFSGKLLDDITAHITGDKELWLDTMMREELKLKPIVKREVLVNSAIVGASTLIGSLIPLAPFFLLPIRAALTLALVISAVALGFIGVYKAHTTIGNPFKSGLQMIFIGLGAAFAGYIIGRIFHV